MKNYNFVFWVPALLILLSLPAIAADPSADNPADQKRVVAKVGEDGIQRVDLIGGEYYFDPQVIVVRVDTPVELRVKKTGGFVPHNIIAKAPEAGIDFNVEMKKEFQPINFTPTRTGRYTIYCDLKFLWFDTHQEKGMEGIIEVVE